MANVLIIDDQEDVALAVSLDLESHGYSSDVVNSGQKGLAIYQEKRHDLVITDIFMPEMEGTKVIEELFAINENVKILAISGGGKETLEWTRLRAQARGAIDFLIKPIKRETLIQHVDDIFKK